MGVDYFSFLPDPIILLIISCLPFRDAAKTSALSKRWLHLWRSTKNIEFEEILFIKQVGSREERELCRRDFIHFVCQWMLDYQEPVADMFRLAFSNPKEYQLEIENCVRFAIAQGVKGLDLDFCDPAWGEYSLDEPPPSFALPSWVYRNGVVLESLKLYSCSFHVPGFSTFTALKNVSIGWSEVTNAALNALLVNCPLLESLSLKKCWNLDDAVICGPKLKIRSLVMDKCAFMYRFTLGAPLLRSLSYSGAVSEFVFVNQPPVDKVELDFGLEPDIDYGGIYGDVIRELLRDLKCTTLTVCSFMLQQLPFSSERMPLWQHLQGLAHLTVKAVVHEYESYGFAFLLSSCTRLHALTIQIVPGRVFPDFAPPSELQGSLVFWRQEEPVSPCMTKTLRVVELMGFGGEPNELQLVKYLLRHGHVMETLNITLKKQKGHAVSDSEANSGFWTQMLQYYAKGSSRLQIFIS